MLDSKTEFQYRLIDMGFDLKIVNRLLEIQKNSDICTLVNMLTMQNDIYLHEFYVKENNDSENCYICGEIESKHDKQKFYKLPYNTNFFGSIGEGLDEDNMQNNNFGNSVIYETSLVDDSYNEFDVRYKEEKKLTTSYVKIESNPKKALTITNLKDKNE